MIEKGKMKEKIVEKICPVWVIVVMRKDDGIIEVETKGFYTFEMLEFAEDALRTIKENMIKVILQKVEEIKNEH